MAYPSGKQSRSVNWSKLLRSHQIRFKANGLLQVTIVAFAVFWVCMAIRPLDWKIWLVENALSISFIILLIWTHRLLPLTNVSYLLIAAFLALHTYGAHFTYQLTPLDDWLKSLFHLKRGIYDRIVHFAFGLFLAFPAREAVLFRLKLRHAGQYAVTFAFIVAASGLFELLEMWAAVLFDPKLAAKYLGMQGDPFDAQKDMTMTLFGVLLALGLFAVQRRIGQKRRKV
ncbi:DUF2238 domain-containing protein [Paenibacillus methanolicus]|uniref:Putative membrane protein n=1 Tax=Paenibacillus methanolicus TaxID=582686 RepID=A0A5S5BYD4_9BACL|nr:DUF2238 domain-containing protein [Paenibacillus methanolicus]TYP72047.1 putative membrane protein [Paenibacillus methanolicus]